MRLLAAADVPSGDVLRTFRHSPLGPLWMSAFFTAPLVALVWNWERVTPLASSIPWYLWIVLGPVVLLGAGLAWLCLSATRSLVHASFLPSNWLVKTTRDGLYLQLRSYQNHHFPLDVPTVAYFGFDELASVRCVKETYDAGTRNRRGPTMRKWLELTLANGDTAEVDAWLVADQKRPAPRTRTLGVSAQTRFNHHPVVAARPGVLYVEWLGRGVWKALAEHVRPAEATAVRLDAPDASTLQKRPLEARINELVARGDTFGAIALARAERKLSLTDAHSLIESVRSGEPVDAQR